MDIILPGDFLFFLPKTKIDRFVCRYAGAYSHCGLYIDDYMFISARPYRGIDFDMIDEYNHFFDIYRIKDITKKERIELIKVAIGYRGKKYDLKQAIALPFKYILPFRSANYFCSEFLSVLSIYLGRITSKVPELMSPTDLSNEPFLDLRKECFLIGKEIES